jgi:hypothetical protein
MPIKSWTQIKTPIIIDLNPRQKGEVAGPGLSI